MTPHRHVRRTPPPDAGRSIDDPASHAHYLSSERVSGMTGLSQEQLVAAAMDLDGDGPLGFPGPDGSLWFNKAAVTAWIRRRGE